MAHQSRPSSAPLGIDSDAEQTEIRRFLKQLAREDAVVIPLLGMRRDLFAAKPFDGLPDHLVLFGEVRVVLLCFARYGNITHSGFSWALIWTNI